MKKLIIAMAAAAAMVPATASAQGQIEEVDNFGPSTSLGHVLSGENSGSPIEIGGEQIDGLTASGSAKHRLDVTSDGWREELEIKNSKLNEGGPGGFVYLALSSFRSVGAAEQDGDKAELRYRAENERPLPLNPCGEIVLGLGNNDIVLATLSSDGDPLSALGGLIQCSGLPIGLP